MQKMYRRVFSVSGGNSLNCGLCGKPIKAEDSTVLFRGKWKVHTKCHVKHTQQEVAYFDEHEEVSL